MRYEILILGMTCTHCQGLVLSALRELNGVLAAEVNLEQGRAWVDTIRGITADQLKDVVEESGYQVTRINPV